MKSIGRNKKRVAAGTAGTSNIVAAVANFAGGAPHLPGRRNCWIWTHNERGRRGAFMSNADQQLGPVHGERRFVSPDAVNGGVYSMLGIVSLRSLWPKLPDCLRAQLDQGCWPCVSSVVGK
jgi:hypothetical protein